MSPIFQAGGALPADHATYMEREADRDALRVALDGEYLHVIAPRQMGKTSLLMRLSVNLEKMGWRCAYVDLATFMDFHKPEWYAELGRTLGQSLTRDQIPALTNQIDLRGYLLNQALPCAGGQSCIALFLDEVEGAGKARDAEGQPFSDTFFSMFRALYNERDKIDGTLVVALAGAVNPGDLVSDPDISPFNVGQEISLDDFRAAETQSLTSHLGGLGLPIRDEVHRAVYNWASGHPYLTQRICAELERSSQSGSIEEIAHDHVTRVVEQAILYPVSPLQQDKNLKHVARMLNHLSAPATRLWSRLRTGESISCKEVTDHLCLELYLTGVVKAQVGYLVIRNRIYERAFAEQGQAKSPTARSPKSERAAMNKPIRVFLSSTWQDLQPEREAVEKALHRMQDTAFAGMEHFGSRPETPREVSLQEVDRSDVYVGIFAHRYGSGITEAEYRRAQENAIPCLIYVKDESVPILPADIERDPDQMARLEALKQELKQKHTLSHFRSPDDLATQVIADLHNLVSGMVLRQPGGESHSGPKYQIGIGHAEGVVIGDNAQVSQRFVVSAPSVREETPNSKEQKRAVRADVTWPVSIPTERYYPLPGRERDLDRLLDVLRDPQGSPVVTIEGLGGLGKTALAAELARRVLTQGWYQGVVGESAKQEILTGGELVQLPEASLNFDSLLDAIARQLERWELTTRKTEEKRLALANRLREGRYLVFVDNLETAEGASTLIAQLRSLLDGARAIVTSRLQVRHDFAYPISLAGLNLTDSLFFLRADAEQRNVQQVLEASEADLSRIHEFTGGAPLALKLVVAQARFLDLDLILEQLREARGSLYPFIFRQSWEQLLPAAQRVLIYIGRTVVTTVSWEELADVGIVGGKPELVEAVDQLVAFSLLDPSFVAGQARYGIHQLTRQFINADLPEIWRQQGKL